MTRTKIDNRIRLLIENGIKTSHRSMFVVVGDKGRDQVILISTSSELEKIVWTDLLESVWIKFT